MLLTYEFTDTPTASFYILQNLTFKSMKLRSVDIQTNVGEPGALYGEWASQEAFAPLYLTISGVDFHDVMAHVELTDATTLIPLGTSLPQPVRKLDLPLMEDKLTHLNSGDQITFTLHGRSVATENSYAPPAVLSESDFGEGSRCCVVLELDEGAHHSHEAVKTVVVPVDTYL